jgi:hypothetical protein
MPSGCALIPTSFISITTSSRAWSGYENGRGGGPNLRDGFHPCGKQRAGLTIDGGAVEIWQMVRSYW